MAEKKNERNDRDLIEYKPKIDIPTPTYRNSNKSQSKPSQSSITNAGPLKPLSQSDAKIDSMDDKSFGAAFKAARKQGLKEFTWKGKRYNTRTKEEEAKRKGSKPSRKDDKPPSKGNKAPSGPDNVRGFTADKQSSQFDDMINKLLLGAGAAAAGGAVGYGMRGRNNPSVSGAATQKVTPATTRAEASQGPRQMTEEDLGGIKRGPQAMEAGDLGMAPEKPAQEMQLGDIMFSRAPYNKEFYGQPGLGNVSNSIATASPEVRALAKALNNGTIGIDEAAMKMPQLLEQPGGERLARILAKLM